MNEPGPHDCGPDCHPLRASDGVSPACSDDCQKPLGHAGPCDDPTVAQRRREAAWARRLAATYGPGGAIGSPGARDSDRVPVRLSEGRLITDPDEAEALGLTVEARRMRERGEACPQCGAAPATLIREMDKVRLFGCEACNETWAGATGDH